MQYTVSVKKSGVYTIKINMAADNADGRLTITCNGIKLVNQLSLPNTGGMQAWQTIALKNISLKSGLNKLRIYADAGGFNLRGLEFLR